MEFYRKLTSLYYYVILLSNIMFYQFLNGVSYVLDWLGHLSKCVIEDTRKFISSGLACTKNTGGELFLNPSFMLFGKWLFFSSRKYFIDLIFVFEYSYLYYELYLLTFNFFNLCELVILVKF